MEDNNFWLLMKNVKQILTIQDKQIPCDYIYPFKVKGNFICVNENTIYFYDDNGNLLLSSSGFSEKKDFEPYFSFISRQKEK